MRDSETVAKEIETLKGSESSYTWTCKVCGHGTGKTLPCPTRKVDPVLSANYWSKGYTSETPDTIPAYPHTGKIQMVPSVEEQLHELEAEYTKASQEEFEAREAERREALQQQREKATAEGPAWLDRLECPEHGRGVCPGGMRWNSFVEAHEPIKLCHHCGAEEGSCVHETEQEEFLY